MCYFLQLLKYLLLPPALLLQPLLLPPTPCPAPSLHFITLRRETWIVMDLMDQGNLAAAIRRGAFLDQTGDNIRPVSDRGRGVLSSVVALVGWVHGGIR